MLIQDLNIIFKISLFYKKIQINELPSADVLEITHNQKIFTPIRFNIKSKHLNTKESQIPQFEELEIIQLPPSKYLEKLTLDQTKLIFKYFNPHNFSKEELKVNLLDFIEIFNQQNQNS